jgi:hypothetical protein
MCQVSPRYEMVPLLYSGQVPKYLKRILKKQGFDLDKQSYVLDFDCPIIDKSFIRWAKSYGLPTDPISNKYVVSFCHEENSDEN